MIEPYRLPEDGWYQLSSLGDFGHTPTGLTQVVDEEACRAIVERFNADAARPNFAGLLVDFDHFSLEKDKPSEAAGWITALEQRPGSGLWAQIRWTDKGEEAVAGGRYRFISPVWRRDECVDLQDGKVRPMRLCNAGLTNDPNIGGAVPLSNGFVSDKQRRYFFARKSQGQIPATTTAAGSRPNIHAPPAPTTSPVGPRTPPPELTPDPANLGRFTFKSPKTPAAKRPAPGVPVAGPPAKNLERMPGPGNGKLPIQPLDPDRPHILPVGQPRGLSVSDMEAQTIADYALATTPTTVSANIPAELSKRVQEAKYTFNQEAAKKAIDTLAAMAASQPPTKTRGTAPRTTQKKIAAVPKASGGGKVKTATPKNAPTTGAKGMWKENGIIYINDPEWWKTHRQPELSKPGHLSAAGQWTRLSAQRKKDNQAAMSSRARRQGGMPGMSGLYNRCVPSAFAKTLANAAGPMTDDQRKAMFAKLSGGGATRLPSEAYQPKNYAPTRDHRARLESLQQKRNDLADLAPEAPTVHDFTITDTRALRDDLLRQGKQLPEVQAALREAEARNLRVSLELDKINQRLKARYPDARSRRAALAEELDKIAVADAKAAAAYEKANAAHLAKLAKVDAEIRAESIRRQEDWNKAGTREENDLAQVAEKDAAAAIRAAVQQDKAAAVKALADEKAATAVAKDQDPVRVNAREKANRTAYWDAIERGNLDLAEKIAPGANHDSNLALWDEIRLTPDQAGNAKARTAASAKAAAIRKMSP